MSVDIYYNSVSLLLHGNGTDGSTTFTDNSPSPKTVTPVGDAQIDTAQSKFGGASMLFDGTGDYLTIPDHTDFDFGSSDFTIECFVRRPSSSAFMGVCAKREGFTNSAPFMVLIHDIRKVQFASSFNGTSWAVDILSTGTIAINTWTHIAVVRNNNTFTVYINGVNNGTATVAGSVVANTGRVSIAASTAGGVHPLQGHIDDVRITKGVARYTADFTPPTAELPHILSYGIIGNIPLTLTPNATLTLRDSFFIVGNIPLTLTPSSTLHLRNLYTLVGDIPLTLTPNATLNLRNTFSIVGSIPLTLTPSSTLNLRNRFSIVGSIPLTLTPAATLTEYHQSSLIGDIPLSLTPASTLSQYHQSSIVGDIPLALTPAATLLGPTETITAELDFITTSLSATWGARLDNISFPMPSVSSVMYPDGMSIEAGFIETTLESLTGANASFGFIDTTLSSTGTLTETINANLSFISATLSASVTVDERITASFGFISSTLTALGGANASLSAPTFSFSSTVTVDNLRINANLDFLNTSLSATATMDGRINASFGFIDTYLSYNTITATGPVMSLSATMSSTITPAIAYVMNVHTTESTQYSNYPFLHIIHIGNKPYGVKADGLYLLEGADDNGTVINATMTTKETDFGSYNSKRVPYLYLNSDTATTVTPTVDGELSANAYSSSFGGRKVKIARGWNGRYWKFKINHIQQLEGMEILPESLQRRIN